MMLRWGLEARPGQGLFLMLAVSISGCNLQTVAREPADIPPTTLVAAAPIAEDSLFPYPAVFAGIEPAHAKTQPAPEELAIAPTQAWDRMRNNFRVPYHTHPRLDLHIKWYQNNPDYLARVFERAEPFLGLILDEIDSRDLPAELALLPIVESGFQPFAYSPGQAAGLWQFIPGTGKRFGLKQDWWYDGRRDVIASTRAALKYLDYLAGYFDGDWLLALAAYNSGEGTVGRAVRRNTKQGKSADFWNLDLPKETRDYVPKLLALRTIIADPERFGVQLPDMPADAQIAQVDTDGQIDLALAADLAGLEIGEMYRLNPGFNRWATAPNGPHLLVVPKDRAEVFSSNLAEVEPDQRIAWERHEIKSGESLGLIAKRYDTTVGVLKKANGLQGNSIRAGKHLLIPVARRDLSDYTFSAAQRHHQRITSKIEAGARTHQVSDGDTLWDIARRYGLSVQKLARINGMAPGDRLQPGRKLLVGEGGVASTRSIPRAATRQTVHYTVRRGDSLALISQKFRVTVTELRKWNKLSGNKYLQPGQRLTLYVDVTRQADNS